MDIVSDTPVIAFKAKAAAYNTSAVRSTVCTLKASDAMILIGLPKRSSKYCKKTLIIVFELLEQFSFVVTL